MSKTLKKISIICLSVALALCLFFGIATSFDLQRTGVSANQVATQSEVIQGNYGFKQGAYIRKNLDGQGTGIKFTLQIKQAYYDGLISDYTSVDNLEFGVIIAKNQASIDTVTYENAIDGSNADVKKVTTNSTFNFGDNDYAERDISLIFETNTYSYDDLTVRAYVKPTTASAIYGDSNFADDTRSMSAIANYALNKGDVKLEDVADYLGAVDRVAEEQILDKTASVENFTVDLGQTVTDAKIYNGVTKVTDVTLSGSTLTIPKTTATGEYTLSVIGSGKVVNVDYVCADKVFTQDNKDEIATTFITSAGTTNSGYYILNSNIDNLTFSRTATDGSGNADVKDVFSGTFNGRGYTINNVTANGQGLFGNFDTGATVKNVAFTGVTFGTKGTWRTPQSVLFFGPKDANTESATLENVYASVNEMTASQFGERYAFVATTLSDTDKYVCWNMKNVIIEMPIDQEHSLNKSWNAIYGVWGKAEGENGYNNISDCYGISNQALRTAQGNVGFGNINVYTDRGAMKTADRDYSSFGSNWVLVDGLPVWKSYVENFAELVITNSASQDVEATNLVLKNGDTEEFTFSFKLGEDLLTPTAINLPQNCTALVVDELTLKAGEITAEEEIDVEIVYGELITKSVKVNVTPYVTYDAQVDLDTTSGELYLPTDYASKSIVDVKLDGESVYDAGKVMGITPEIKADRSDVNAISLVIEFADSSVMFTNVKPYTKIFSEENKADLISTFVANTAVTNSGYYVLRENIKDISFERTGMSQYSTRYPEKMDIFTGVFDGRGYTISNLGVKGAGLFGDFGSGATVKNVAFEMDFGSPTYHTYGLFCQAVAGTTSATLENVYIKVKEITSLSQGDKMCYLSPIAYCMSGHADKFDTNAVAWTIKNVITEMPVAEAVGVNTSWTGSFSAAGWFDLSTISGAYAISKVNKAGNNSYYTDSIKHYTTVALMKEANNSYTDFANSGFWTVATGEIPVWKTLPVAQG